MGQDALDALWVLDQSAQLSSPPHSGQAVVGSPNVRALSSRQDQ